MCCDNFLEYASDYFHNSTEFWIGANSLEVQNIWEWTDGSAFDLKDWKKGEPRNGTDLRCVAAIMKDGYWKAESCFKQKPFICETSSDATITSTIKQSTTTITTKKPVPTTTSSASNYSIIVNCSTGWTYFEQTKSLYCIFDAPKGWQNGEDYCKNLGGHLASVHSDEENELLKTAKKL
uniref:C-type lectin domain-containing protein n=1 Tax=Panagrolaimus sp. PS1159 TaxID=55785 RepID=A0AC35G721_9BILA